MRHHLSSGGTPSLVPEPERFSARGGTNDWWEQHRGEGPIIATAIHNGHCCGHAVAQSFALSEEGRLREEDPFTEYLIRDVPNRVVVHRSRFEVDINRSRDLAVYVRPEQSWGLKVWREPPHEGQITEALSMHEQFYAMLHTMLSGIAKRHGRFVVLDVHSYNHRRHGANGPPADPALAPEVNIGTFSMPPGRWRHVLEPLIDAIATYDYRGRRLDVRCDVAFQGKGELARFVHDGFPEGCAIAIEFKKFFMDEWTGEPYPADLIALRRLIKSALPVIEKALLADP